MLYIGAVKSSVSLRIAGCTFDDSEIGRGDNFDVRIAFLEQHCQRSDYRIISVIK